MESIEAMVVELDPTFQVDEMLLNPHPFNLSITEGGGDEVFLFLLSFSRFLSLSLSLSGSFALALPRFLSPSPACAHSQS